MNEPSLLDVMMKSMSSGTEFTGGAEVLRHAYVDSHGADRYAHKHPGYQRNDHVLYRAAPWVRERLVWLAQNRPGPVVAYLRAVGPEYAGLDAAGLLHDLESCEPALCAQARIDLRGVDLGAILTAGLWGGAEYVTCNSGGGDSWKRQGDIVRYDSSDRAPGDFVSYTREQVVPHFGSWGDVTDGLVVPGFAYDSALDQSLRVLGAPTLRAYLVTLAPPAK